MLSHFNAMQKHDKEFQPGSWFVESKYFDAKNPTPFNKIERVEKQADGFKWVSWHKM